MARLPTPILESIKITWPEDHKEREKSFYEILGEAIRKRSETENKEEDKED